MKKCSRHFLQNEKQFAQRAKPGNTSTNIYAALSPAPLPQAGEGFKRGNGFQRAINAGPVNYIYPGKKLVAKDGLTSNNRGK